MPKILPTRGGWYQLIPVGEPVAVSTWTSPDEHTVPDGANGVLVYAEDQDVWFRVGGGAPDATTHFVIKAGEDAQILPFGPGTVITFDEAAAGATLQKQNVRAY